MTEVRLGDKRIPFIYQGNELLHPNPVKDGLILWYDFSAMTNSDVSKGIAKDLSGNGNDGTLQNFNYTAESGYVGDGLKFDGVDDGVVVPKDESHEIIGGITLEQTLIKTAEHDPSDGGGWDWLIMNGNLVTASEGFGLLISSNGNLSFSYGGVNTQTDYFVKEGDKFHVVATCTNDFKVKIIVNGEILVDRVRDSTVPKPSERDIGIGRATYYDSPRLDADIYSTRIYNRPLTAEEIQHNYQLEKARFGL